MSTPPAPKVGTLGQLAADGRTVLRLICSACGRVVDHHPQAIAALARRHGAGLTLERLRTRATCQGCGARGGAVDLNCVPVSAAPERT